MAKRSPNYPTIGLGSAIEHLEKLWHREEGTPVPVEVAVKAWGYKGLSGASRTKIAALKKYGLLDDGKAGMVAVSDLGKTITLFSKESSERSEAIAKASTNPVLFGELFENYGRASDDAIRAYLITKRGFSKAGAEAAVQAFRETAEYVTVDKASARPIDTEDDESRTPEPPKLGDGGAGRSVSDPKPEKPGMKQDVFALEEGSATISWPSQLSQESFEVLEAWLQLVILKAKRSVVREDWRVAKSIAKGDTLDVSSARRDANSDYILEGDLLKVFEKGIASESGIDLYDTVAKQWLMSVGKHHTTGQVVASTTGRFADNPEYECLYLL